MKQRSPKRAAPALDAIGRDTETLTRSFAVETITPIYGGGVEAGSPDLDMPIRASAIRGQLHFWWRMLNRAAHRKPVDLFKAERALFGGMANQGGVTASLFDLWVTDVQGARTKQPYGPAYAIFPLRDKPDAEVLEEGLEFRLHVLVRPGIDREADLIWTQSLLPALCWWASFGGLGSRTRRGMGAIKVEDLASVTADEANRYGCAFEKRQAKKKPLPAWNEAVDKLESFRQKPGTGRNLPGKDPKCPGRSRWPEPDSIREITGRFPSRHAPQHPAHPSFPRAAFGLPIITHFKGGGEPKDTSVVPVVDGRPMERLASPLILKPMWNGSGYEPVALLLPRDHLNQMGLRLDNNPGAYNPNLPYDLAAGAWWPAAASGAMIGGATETPLKHRTGDVLADFLDFFRS